MPDPFPPLAGRNPGRILVVDDDAKNRLLLRELIEARGDQVLEAEDGQTALALAAEHLPDAIVLDIMMPGMDGFEVCRRLKENRDTVHIPVLIVTALTEREDRLRGIDAGANDFISKPVDQQEVLLRLRNAVYGKQLYDQLQKNFKTLREMEELRDSLRALIEHDTEAMASLVSFVKHIEATQKGTRG